MGRLQGSLSVWGMDVPLRCLRRNSPMPFLQGSPRLPPPKKTKTAHSMFQRRSKNVGGVIPATTRFRLPR